jgi:outer membrane protein OmpA-like peptidoglycan-associated protein
MTSPGEFTYLVTATSLDGQATTTDIHYRVVARSTSLVILFPNNSWSLTRSAISKLNGFARILAGEHFRSVAISGFASSTGPNTNNDNLGIQRAHVAWKYLLSRLHKLKDRDITTSLAGFGATHFRVTPTAAAQNRRAVLTAS